MQERVLVCSPSGLFDFRLLFAPTNCLEIRNFRGDCLNFWLFIKKKCISFVKTVFKKIRASLDMEGCLSVDCLSRIMDIGEKEKPGSYH